MASSCKTFLFFLSLLTITYGILACGEEDLSSALNELTACEEACSRISREECLSGDDSADFASSSCLTDCEEGRYGEDFASCVLQAMSCEALAVCLAAIEPGSASQQWNGDEETYSEDTTSVDPQGCYGSCTEGSLPYCLDSELCSCRNEQWELINCRVTCAEVGQTFNRCASLEETTQNQCICDAEPIPEECQGECQREGQGACRIDETLCICESGEWTLIDCADYCLDEHGMDSGQCTTSAEMNGAQCNCETGRYQ